MKTQTQIEQYEQKIQTAVSTVKPLAENVFSVPSSRKGVMPHIVTTIDGIANYCTCEHYENNGWNRDGHKCYHAQAVERYIEAAKQAVNTAEEILAEAAKTPEEIKTESQIESYVRQGISRATAEAVVLAKGIKDHGNAKCYERAAFSLLK